MVHGQYIIIGLQTQDFREESRFFLKGSRFYLYRYRKKPVYNKLTNETEEQRRLKKRIETGGYENEKETCSSPGRFHGGGIPGGLRRKAEAQRELIPRQPQVRRLKIRRQQLPATRP